MKTIIFALIAALPASAAAFGPNDDCRKEVQAFAKALNLSDRANRQAGIELYSETEMRTYEIRTLLGNYTNLYRLVLSNDSHDKCRFSSLELLQSGE
jgi:hypothetical protein